MKTKNYKLFGLLILLAVLLAGCQTMTPKKQLTLGYGAYNTQYSQYMSATGYVMDTTGAWVKTTSPELSEDQRKILQSKKKVLTQMYPLLKLYDSMVVGTVPYSSATEAELLSLIDQLALLGGVE